MSATVRVLSANLAARSLHVDEFLELLEREQVDVLCAQELNRWIMSALRPVLPAGDLLYPGLFRGVGIGARRRIITKPLPLPRRNGCVATLNTEDWPQLSASLDIANVHILGPHVWPVIANPRLRKAQLSGLLSFLEENPSGSLAVMGDFNASPGWPLYRRLASRLSDAALEHKHSAGPTWPSYPGLGVRGLFRIDHCFVQNAAVTAWRRVDIQGSDHLGLLLDIRPS